MNELVIGQGQIIRLAMLMTHYRHNLDWSEKRQKEAAKIMNRWVKVIEPTIEGCPVEVMECLMDDLNTPKAISIMHGYLARKEGKKLFSAMAFLGLIGGAERAIDDWRTLPDDQIDKLGFSSGPEALAWHDFIYRDRWKWNGMTIWMKRQSTQRFLASEETLAFL